MVPAEVLEPVRMCQRSFNIFIFQRVFILRALDTTNNMLYNNPQLINNNFDGFRNFYLMKVAHVGYSAGSNSIDNQLSIDITTYYIYLYQILEVLQNCIKWWTLSVHMYLYNVDILWLITLVLYCILFCLYINKNIFNINIFKYII